ncbi:MAG: T9SS type A sorting domain-containing protein, partial [Bacteroidales bacterium]|nr:T9SS type A sorting domain-containing protein [Bacteroidales bacterium]
GSAIDAVSSDEIQIRVVNGRIECDCEDYTIYNVAGQKVQNNASLPSGTYFVHCNQQVKKVVVQ